MKATNLLKRQHRMAERLFKQIQRSKDEAERGELVTELANALAAHMMIEERIFYPAAQEVLSGKKALMGETAYLEHMSAKAALANVLGEGPMSFEARLKVLRELVEHHVQEEEEALFPELEALIDEAQMKELGAQMQEAHEQAMALGHEGIMAQDMQIQGGGRASEAASTGSGSGSDSDSDSDGAEAGSRGRVNGTGRKTARSGGGRSQARAS